MVEARWYEPAGEWKCGELRGERIAYNVRVGASKRGTGRKTCGVTRENGPPLGASDLARDLKP